MSCQIPNLFIMTTKYKGRKIEFYSTNVFISISNILTGRKVSENAKKNIIDVLMMLNKILLIG